MNIRTLGAAALALATALVVGGPAAASVTVIGDSSAEDCSHAAFDGRADSTTLQACNVALQNGELDRRDQAGTYVNRGVLYLLLNNYQAARDDFDQAIRIAPEMGEGWVNRGAVDIGLRRYQDGVSDINKALALGLGDPAKAYYNRAIAFEGLDDEKSAYLDYQQALQLKPDWDLPKHELLRFTVTRR
jgi:tetratricopeptide (TPR) repeat protein